MSNRERSLPEVPSTEEDIVQVFDDFVQKQLLDVHTMLPGRILSYEGHATRKAQVEISVNIPTNTGEFLKPNPISNVPIVFPSVGAASLLLPIAKGDGVLLCFSEVAIGNFLNGEVTVDPEGYIRFSTNECVAIPGLFSNPKIPVLAEEANATDTYLMQGDSILKLSDGDVTIKKGTTSVVLSSGGDVTVTSDAKTIVNGSAIELNGNTKSFVTHAELDTALQGFITALNLHVHATAAVGPPVPPTVPMTLNIASSATTTVKTGG